MGTLSFIRAGLADPKLFAMEAGKILYLQITEHSILLCDGPEVRHHLDCPRLSTVENADRVYAVEDSRISEYGSISDLLTKDGTYAELYGIHS